LRPSLPPFNVPSLIKYLVLFVLVAGIVLTGLTLLKIRSEGDQPKPRRKRPPNGHLKG